MSAVPCIVGEPMVAMSREEIARDIAIGVITPPIQFGRGRQLPIESDAARQHAAELIVAHFERQRGALVQARAGLPGTIIVRKIYNSA